MKKIGILEPDNFSEVAIEMMSKDYLVEKYNQKESIEKFIEDKFVIFIRLKYPITKELLKNSKVKWICSPTTGLNHIDYLLHPNVISLKGEYEFLETIRATPEHSFGLALALLRNYNNAFLSQNNKEWNRELYKGFEIYNNNIGIIGFGRVGKILCNYYNAFGANVYYYDTNQNIVSEVAKRCENIDDLIKKSTIIHLCVNYTDENKNMITSKEFNLMENKYFINTARGELIDEASLMNFLNFIKYKGVALDVLSNETGDLKILSDIIPLLKKKNIIITPHISGATYSSMHKTEEFIAQKLLLKLESKIE